MARWPPPPFKRSNMPNQETETAKTPNVERWISARWRKHSVIVPVKERGKETSKLVTFDNYGMTLDLGDPEQAQISKGLHNCGREGRDLFVIRDEPYAENAIGNKASMLRTLRDMNIAQLRAMVSLDEMIEANVPTNTRDTEDLIALIMARKSIKE